MSASTSTELGVPTDAVVVTMVYEEGPLLGAPDATPRVLIGEGFHPLAQVRASAAQSLATAVARTLRQAGPPPPGVPGWRELDELGVWVAYAWWESTVPGQPPRERFRRRRLRCARIGLQDVALAAVEWRGVDEEDDDTRPFFDALREADGRRKEG